MPIPIYSTVCTCSDSSSSRAHCYVCAFSHVPAAYTTTTITTTARPSLAPSPPLATTAPSANTVISPTLMVAASPPPSSPPIDTAATFETLSTRLATQDQRLRDWLHTTTNSEWRALLADYDDVVEGLEGLVASSREGSSGAFAGSRDGIGGTGAGAGGGGDAVADTGVGAGASDTSSAVGVEMIEHSLEPADERSAPEMEWDSTGVSDDEDDNQQGGGQIEADNDDEYTMQRLDASLRRAEQSLAGSPPPSLRIRNPAELPLLPMLLRQAEEMLAEPLPPVHRIRHRPQGSPTSASPAAPQASMRGGASERAGSMSPAPAARTSRSRTSLATSTTPAPAAASTTSRTAPARSHPSAPAAASTTSRTTTARSTTPAPVVAPTRSRTSTARSTTPAPATAPATPPTARSGQNLARVRQGETDRLHSVGQAAHQAEQARLEREIEIGRVERRRVVENGTASERSRYGLDANGRRCGGREGGVNEGSGIQCLGECCRVLNAARAARDASRRSESRRG